MSQCGSTYNCRSFAEIYLVRCWNVQQLLTITRVPDQNGVSRLYNVLEIFHSGPELSQHQQPDGSCMTHAMIMAVLHRSTRPVEGTVTYEGRVARAISTCENISHREPLTTTSPPLLSSRKTTRKTSEGGLVYYHRRSFFVTSCLVRECVFYFPFVYPCLSVCLRLSVCPAVYPAICLSIC